MPIFAAPSRRFALVALLCAASLAGCDEGRINGPVAEAEDSNFQDGKRLSGEGKDREALQAFGKVILSRHEAPEAHLEAGNLCLNLKNPLEAIFHFNQYLKLRPDAVQAGVVQQRIRTAEKEFLKTLPFRPPEGNNADRVTELMDQLKLVRAENDELKRRQTTLLTAAAARSASVAAGTLASDSVDTVATSPGSTTPPAGSVNKPAGATPAARRTHTIAKGDSLVVISRKYYGTPNRWKDILNANTRVMKNERDLKIGRVLEIPE